MEISERGLHAFRTIVRKIGRLTQEDKAKVYRLLDQNPIMIEGDKAEYAALPEDLRIRVEAFILDEWHTGMKEVMDVLEELTADGKVTVYQYRGR